MTHRHVPTLVLVLMAVALAGAGCGDDDDDSTSPPDSSTSDATETTAADVAVDTTTTTAAPVDTTTTAPAPAAVPDYGRIVEILASDELNGRNDATPESVASQDAIIDELVQFAQPLAGSADDREAYRAPFGGGTNVLAVIPGTDLAGEYVVVGAHYDHLGNECRYLDDVDVICNGATDNATGVAAALVVGRALAEGDTPPRRSIVLAFWDIEEDSLGGSAAYVAAPPVPLAQTIAYVNFDIQGANLSPSLANLTVMVGAETGGPNLLAAAERATAASTLDTASFSLLFGQGRSDHANFASAGVPTVFFTDANSPCYHTTGDDLSIVDFDKLGQQIATAVALTSDLASTEDVPVFDAAAPLASFADAETMLAVLGMVEPDLGLYPDSVVSFYDGFVAELQSVVAEGDAQFDQADVTVLLGGSVQLVEALTTGDCEGFLD